MLPRWHILLGFLFSLVIYFSFGLDVVGFLILFISTFALDFDHYLWYIIKFKNLSFINAYNYFIKRRKKIKKLLKSQKIKLLLEENRIFIFHFMEIIIVFFIAFFFLIKKFNLNIIYAYLFLLGTIFHIFLDILSGDNIMERYSLIFFYLAKRK